MKKFLIGVVVFLVLVLAALIAAPYLFKEQIKNTIDEQIAANINAEVQFDIDNFNLSIFPNFPNLTASITELGVIGRDEFAGEVLFAIDEFEVEVNLSKLLFDDQMSIQSISLINPQIFIKVLVDGTANYDITISTEEEIDTTAVEESDFTMAIENWQITGGHIIYDDATIPTYLELENIDHKGSGNFSLSVFDLTTRTDVLLRKLSYDGENYMSNRNLSIDMILNMDLDNMKFTFKENEISINEFFFGFDGWVAMPADDIDMDISYTSRDNTFKSLISLIPAIYSEDFKDLKSSGTVSFDGAVNGTYNETSMPAFNVKLAVNDGMFQYPDLPDAISNVQVDMLVVNEDGNMDNTKIEISKFHIDFGQEPFDGFINIGNLVTYPIDMGIKTTLDLGNLSKLFPTEGLEMSGTFKADIKVNGVYDSVKAIIPKIDANMSLINAKILYADLPAPLNDLNFEANISNGTGNMNDTKLGVSSFNMDLDGSPISGSLLVEDLDDYRWKAALEGNLDFSKLFPIINRLYPLPGTTIDGEIAASFKTEGKMSDVDSEHYERLTTSGSFVFNNFTYTDSVYLPQGIIIKSGEFAFNPKQMEVKSLSTVVGKSDFSVNGTVTNYIKYLFNEGETIVGKISLQSNIVDLNEWMIEDETPSVEEVESEPYSVIEVPGNINFTMQANIKRVLYEEMVMQNARGKIIVRNGILYLDNLTTSTLGGTIVFNGNYNTNNPKVPKFDMDLGINNIDIQESFKAFNTVQKLAPIAENMNGNLTTNFKMKGDLDNELMPVNETVNGGGLLKIEEAILKGGKFVTALSKFTSKGGKEEMILKDIKLDVTITNGIVTVAPFDVIIDGHKSTISGNTALDGALDYKIATSVPAGQLGKQANAALAKLTGSTEEVSSDIKLNLRVTGPYDSPKISLIGSDAKDAIKEQVTKAAVDKAVDVVKQNTGVDIPTSKEELNKEAIEKAKKESDNLLAEAQKQADIVKAEAKKTAEKIRAEAKVQNDNLIKEAGTNPFKKKVAEVAGKKLIQEAGNKANQVETEGNKRADAIMVNAREKANTLIKNAESK